MNVRAIQQLDLQLKLNQSKNYLIYAENYPFTSYQLKLKRVLSFLMKKLIKYLTNSKEDLEYLKIIFQILKYLNYNTDLQKERVEKDFINILDYLKKFIPNEEIEVNLVNVYNNAKKIKKSPLNQMFYFQKVVHFFLSNQATNQNIQINMPQAQKNIQRQLQLAQIFHKSYEIDYLKVLQERIKNLIHFLEKEQSQSNRFLEQQYIFWIFQFANTTLKNIKITLKNFHQTVKQLEKDHNKQQKQMQKKNTTDKSLKTEKKDSNQISNCDSLQNSYNNSNQNNSNSNNSNLDSNISEIDAQDQENLSDIMEEGTFSSQEQEDEQIDQEEINIQIDDCLQKYASSQKSVDMVINLAQLIGLADQEQSLNFAQQQYQPNKPDSFLLKKYIFNSIFKNGELATKEQILEFVQADPYDLDYISRILRSVPFCLKIEDIKQEELENEFSRGNSYIWGLLNEILDKKVVQTQYFSNFYFKRMHYDHFFVKDKNEFLEQQYIIKLLQHTYKEKFEKEQQIEKKNEKKQQNYINLENSQNSSFSKQSHEYFEKDIYYNQMQKNFLQGLTPIQVRRAKIEIENQFSDIQDYLKNKIEVFQKIFVNEPPCQFQIFFTPLLQE
ncbi:hypothetical protein PPERSA_12330 [Pseudocohnilembus persalinus]|uniref:Uncharacterized protein n=1 Tax=Pseudocohnilembus persalinus TaxID=266149 RepID=A0A0V0R0U3_PSEPJ|nr:hypothetical protein PPERSA_12330 [Pseudocohnilembus persalinus]|eukprot:KRX08175.1 hypothetical protein PPERSA_12330 [Pseudocohnilembus persalinus]